MIRVYYRDEIKGYTISAEGPIRYRKLTRFFEREFIGKTYSNVLVDISEMNFMLTQKELSAVIKMTLGALLKHVKERVAIVSHGNKETAFAFILDERLRKKGLISKVFFRIENAIHWLKIGV